MRLPCCLRAGLLLLGAATGYAWEPAAGPLRTRWTGKVDPTSVHAEYPRPQMVRQEWLNLNGLWRYAVTPRASEAPPQGDAQTWGDSEILVPFPIESSLSGVMKTVGEQQRLWYRREFAVPAAYRADGRHVLLHFGAVDWEARVWLNDRELGLHRGGYAPFSFDITESLAAEGPQDLVIGVWDPTNRGSQPRGKQVENPKGIWYTAVTGIWQTVWVESVPAVSITDLALSSDIEAGTVRVGVETRGAGAGHRLAVTARDNGAVVGRASGPVGQPLEIKIKAPKLWSPASPQLYDLEIALLEGTTVIDSVGSYIGLRRISIGKDADGTARLMLNGAPLFQFGPLDQGWWPDGLYTAPTDAALRYDLEDAQTWRYTTVKPPANWFAADFDDAAWKTGPAGFGTQGTPGAVVRTSWNTSDIWLRREFTLGRNAAQPHFDIHHDEDVEIYINGRPAGSFSDYTTAYSTLPLEPGAAKALRQGQNVIAVHCRQTRGGQYVDVGLVDVIEAEEN